jgi:hypothetical protein
MGPDQNSLERILWTGGAPNLLVSLSERFERLFHQGLCKTSNPFDFLWFRCRSGDKAECIALSHSLIAENPEFYF